MHRDFAIPEEYIRRWLQVSSITFRLNLVTDPEKVEILTRRLLSMIPNAKLSFKNAGSMTFTIQNINDLYPFFKIINYNASKQSNEKIYSLTPQALLKI